METFIFCHRKSVALLMMLQVFASFATFYFIETFMFYFFTRADGVTGWYIHKWKVVQDIKLLALPSRYF